MTTSTEPLTDAYLLECEQHARRFQGAWTGTSGDLAARLMHCLSEVRRLRVEAAMKENEPRVSYQ
jgi:hypothetical protein